MIYIQTMYKKIKTEVKKITKLYQTNDPTNLADNMGILLIKNDLGNVDGFLQSYSDSFIIHINSNINDKKQKDKVISHELGHFILHKHLNVFKFSSHSLSLTGALEREANIFSTELLLTDDMLLHEAESISGMNINEIATYFNIDEEVATMKYELIESTSFFYPQKERTFV